MRIPNLIMVFILLLISLLFSEEIPKTEMSHDFKDFVVCTGSIEKEHHKVRPYVIIMAEGIYRDMNDTVPVIRRWWTKTTTMSDGRMFLLVPKNVTFWLHLFPDENDTGIILNTTISSNNRTYCHELETLSDREE